MDLTGPGTGPPKSELSIESLTELREKTEAIAALLRSRLSDHLEALRPVLAPRRILGRHVRSGARDEVLGSERAFAKLKERYAQICGRPFSLSRELGDEPLEIDPVLELAPFAYRHTLAGDPPRLVTITNPVCWTLHYRGGYTLAELEAALDNRSNLRPTDARQFLVGALALQLLFETFPELQRLLEDLRYDVRSEQRPQLGALPLLTIRAPLPAFRPPDPFIATATRFSGVQAFIELIDVDALPNIYDPILERIRASIQ